MSSSLAASVPLPATGLRASRSAFALVTTLFFVWGFLTVLNDTLIPHFKSLFDLNYARVMFVQFTFFAGYVVMSLPAGWATARLGYRRSMALGLAVMGVGALLFLPSAWALSYPMFLFALFVLASGMTLLQVACNPYVTVLGPPESASSRLNLAQAFNSLGAALAPWVGGLLFLSGTDGGTASEAVAAAQPSAAALNAPYLAFALVLFALAAVVLRFRWPELARAGGSARPSAVINGRRVTSAWRVRHLVLGALAILLYCGAEVSIGSFLVNFFARPEIAGLPERVGARYAAYYWTGAMIGRFAGAALLRVIPGGRLLGCCALAASGLVWLCICTTGSVALWAIILVGLFNSIMFPTIFALAIDGLGELTGPASGILFLGVIGPAVMPVLQGLLADRIGIQSAFVLPALCYLYVLYYGFRGCRHDAATAAAS